MNYIDTDIVAEVRCNRELLLEWHGSIDGLHRYMDENKTKLEEEGWKFVSIPIHNLVLTQ
jgi:hypothetical protein